MPGARLMLNVPAASAAPVPPAPTSACARPSATALAACTIDASGVLRTAPTGSVDLAIATGASTISTPSGAGPSSSAAPTSILGAPLRGAAVGLLFLGDCHRPDRLPAPPGPSVLLLVELQLPQLGPARVGRGLVEVLGPGLVEVDGAHRAEARAVGATEDLHRHRQSKCVVRPRREVERLILNIGAVELLAGPRP